MRYCWQKLPGKQGGNQALPVLVLRWTLASFNAGNSEFIKLPPGTMLFIPAHIF